MSTSSGSTRKQISHDNIVRVAGRAMRRGGYDGASVAEIMKQAGLTHGGFYAHFDSREAMLVEALERSGDSSAAQLAEGVAQLRALGASPMQALLQAYLSDRHLAACDDGCPLAALGSEMPRQGEALQQAARHRLAVLLELVRQALPPASAALAPALLSSLVGALQMARVLGDNAQGRAWLHSNREALLARYDTDGPEAVHRAASATPNHPH